MTVPYPPGGLYPAVGLHSDGEQVRLNLDAEWHEETVAFGGENRTIPKQFRHERIVIDGEYLRYILWLQKLLNNIETINHNSTCF